MMTSSDRLHRAIDSLRRLDAPTDHLDRAGLLAVRDQLIAALAEVDLLLHPKRENERHP